MNKKIFKIPAFIALGAAGMFVIGYIFMLLWNELATYIFHAPVISFWQGVGLLLLSRMMFGGFGKHGDHKRWNKHNEAWHRKFEEKLASMTPEEREKYRETRKRHVCYTDKDTSESTNN